ncbi:hypothetical protein Hanom_Chr07g00640441 [Helianthus anomalus]
MVYVGILYKMTRLTRQNDIYIQLTICWNTNTNTIFITRITHTGASFTSSNKKCHQTRHKFTIFIR